MLISAQADCGQEEGKPWRGGGMGYTGCVTAKRCVNEAGNRRRREIPKAVAIKKSSAGTKTTRQGKL